MLEYGLATKAPITLITGDVGAGKTTLLHHLLKDISDDLVIGLISNAQGGRGDLIRWLVTPIALLLGLLVLMRLGLVPEVVFH